MKTAIRIYLLILFYSTSLAWLGAQNYKAKEAPMKFIEPTYYENEVSMANFMYDKGPENKEKIWWFVVADRDQVKTYEKPDASSAQKGTLTFLKYYYVVDEEEKWIKIVEGPQPKSNGKWSSPIKEKGWVSKDDVLLWQGSLKSEGANIHMKGFILNKLSNISKILEEGSKDFANVYNSPTSNVVSKQLRFYDLYFIYKIENGRMLLGKDYFLSRNETKENLVGWVEESKVDKWYTRIALEPNFDEAAYMERKSKKENNRVVGFKKAGNAIAYLRSGNIKQDQVVWDNDPVLEKFEYLSPENPRRYKGGVYRFPLLNLDNVANKKYFESGTIGQVTTKTANEFGISFSERDPLLDVDQSDDILDKARDEKDNINIFFLIEDIPSVAPYKDVINNVLGASKSIFANSNNVRFGAAFYIDSNEKPNGKDLRLTKLTTDQYTVSEEILGSEYTKVSDFDDYNAMYYALNESLIRGGFTSNATNIIIAIGENADISASRKRVLSNSNDKEYFVDMDELKKELTRYNPHMIFAQVQSEEKKAQRRYLTSNRDLVNEVCYTVFNDFHNGLLELYAERYENSVPTPSMDQITQGEPCLLKMGTSKSRLISPEAGTALDKSVMLSFIRTAMNDISDDVTKTYDDFSSIVNEGKSIEEVSSGIWEPSLCRLIYNNLNKSKSPDNNFKDQLKRIVDEKYRLFNKIYLPQKAFELESSLYDYVLFMPERDLREHIRALEDLSRSGNGPVSDQRIALFESIKSLIESYSGEKIRSKDVKAMTMNDVRALMQGIQEQGYFIGDRLSDKIGIQQINDIMDEKIVSDSRFEEILRIFREKRKVLESIIKQGDKYEFSYGSSKDGGSLYFWIPSELLL
jgi:hypothetical protein